MSHHAGISATRNAATPLFVCALLSPGDLASAAAPASLPDLIVDDIKLEDCATRGPAVRNRKQCLRVGYRNNTTAFVSKAWRTRCRGGPGAGLWTASKGEVAGTYYGNGYYPMQNEIRGFVVEVGTWPPGNYPVTCDADVDNAIAESNETNNSLLRTVTVFADTASFTYDVTLTRISDKFDALRKWQERPYFDVWVKNLGNQTVNQVGVECMVGSVRFGSLSGGPTYEAGSEKPFAVLSSVGWSQIPEGRHNINCTVRVVTPGGVTETNPANNALSGHIAYTYDGRDLRTKRVDPALKLKPSGIPAPKQAN